MINGCDRKQSHISADTNCLPPTVSGHICEEKYNEVESLREQDGSNAADALKKYKELREQGYTPEQIKNGDYKKSSDFGKGGNDTVLALPAPSGTNPWLEGSEIVSMLAPTDCYIDMALALDKTNQVDGEHLIASQM